MISIRGLKHGKRSKYFLITVIAASPVIWLRDMSIEIPAKNLR
jgi:hypothetical protein